MDSNLNAPLVSVICPLFDKQKYIAETIHSLLDQSYSNWELIIIDDGSTDNSIQIVKQFSDKRIKFFERKDFKEIKGGSVCRNIGIKEANGEFVIFLDADDMLKPNCLAHRIEYIQQSPNFDFYVFNIERFINTKDNLVGKSITYYFEKLLYYLAGNKQQYFLRKFLTYSTQWSICNPIWEKEALVKLGGFNESFQRLQDPELHTRALIDGYNFKFLKYNTIADVSVRNDLDRRSTINNKQMFERVAVSIEQYINTMHQILLSKNEIDKIKYLTCYAILIEQITAGYINATAVREEQDFFLNRRTLFYNNLQLNMDKNYLFFKKSYRSLASQSLLRKMRIPALYVYLYKFFI